MRGKGRRNFKSCLAFLSAARRQKPSRIVIPPSSVFHLLPCFACSPLSLLLQCLMGLKGLHRCWLPAQLTWVTRTKPRPLISVREGRLQFGAAKQNGAFYLLSICDRARKCPKTHLVIAVLPRVVIGRAHSFPSFPPLSSTDLRLPPSLPPMRAHGGVG